jgi:hypothetical protein
MVKRYAVLAYGALGTMADVGLLVLGSLLVGLAVSVLLAGFGLVDVVTEEISTGPMLVSALVLAVAGLFCLGLASEGPLGRGRRLIGFQLWEVGLGRIIAVVVVGFLGYFAHGLLEGVIEGLPVPLLKGAVAFRTVGVAGMTAMPLIGVPLSMLLRGAPVEQEWIHRADVPALFVVWSVATLILL